MNMNQAKKHILLAAHGSKNSLANEEVCNIAQQLELNLANHCILPCFLELATPSIDQALDTCIQQNIHKIYLLPYFLVQGRHLQQDIPQIIESKRKAHPHVEIILLDYLGSEKNVLDVLLKLLTH